MESVQILLQLDQQTENYPVSHIISQTNIFKFIFKVEAEKKQFLRIQYQCLKIFGELSYRT